MRLWTIHLGEQLPTDQKPRLFRNGMLSQKAAEMGHEVVTWAPTFSHLEKRRRSDTEDQIEITKNWRVQLFECGAYQKNIGLGRFRFHRAAVASFERLARTLPRPDVVFCSLPTPAMVKSAIRFAKRNPGTQVVIDVRDLWPDVYMTLLPHPIKALAQFGLRHITTFNRSIMRDADAVTAVSETYLAWAQNSAGDIALGNARVFMIGYQPSEPSDIVPVNPQVTSAISQATAADLSICFVGQLSHFSQLDTVVSAVLELEQKNNCKIALTICGTGPKLKDLEAQAKGSKAIHFTHWIEAREIMTVIEAHDLGVLSYSNDAPQSLPNKPFEYLAYGAALISNLDGELKTITADNSIGFHFSNKAELLALLEDLLNNPEKTRRARKNATTFFKNQCSADTIYTDLTRALENQASHGRLDPSQDA